MKAVAYSIQSFEKEPLALANHKKHEITLISNSLTEETALYATGKEAVIVFSEDLVSAAVINKLADLGVKFLATRSSSTSHIDQDAAATRHIKIANVPEALLGLRNTEELAMALAEETILNLDKWQGKACLGASCVCANSCRSMKDLFNKDVPEADHEH
ncbi:Rossmann-fold NAD(P)-binding domain-containing protein [Pedobacter duraquae]|uniref:D-isomer specific 2-hydroxyacid dehydrogenase-like protein n=1 Tax=Pedobacter duraquae TaxID=425511 RepID=A0A4R6IR23_9SPHI|nr:lactate dehydrogenase [Pedobacter duraquae]TDO24819.1 D-isomer specific 2-hydroxyacid dehydrogenase-like protein [Pedobacter duraquae]